MFTAKFKGDLYDPWGFEVNFHDHWKNWKVSNVYPKQQAERLGLAVGDKIISINGVEINGQNFIPMKETLIHGHTCKITLQKKNASSNTNAKRLHTVIGHLTSTDLPILQKNRRTNFDGGPLKIPFNALSAKGQKLLDSILKGNNHIKAILLSSGSIINLSTCINSGNNDTVTIPVSSLIKRKKISADSWIEKEEMLTNNTDKLHYIGKKVVIPKYRIQEKGNSIKDIIMILDPAASTVVKQSMKLGDSGHHLRFYRCDTVEDRCVQSNRSIESYYEVTIIELSRNVCLALGFSTKLYPSNTLPGWKKISIGYHGDDGRIFFNSKNGSDYGHIFRQGDTVGCGFITNSAGYQHFYFTHNGKNLGIAFTTNKLVRQTYAVIGADGNCAVKINFGSDPFKSPIKKSFQAIKNTVQKIKKSLDLVSPKRKELYEMLKGNEYIEQIILNNDSRINIPRLHQGDYADKMVSIKGLKHDLQYNGKQGHIIDYADINRSSYIIQIHESGELLNVFPKNIEWQKDLKKSGYQSNIEIGTPIVLKGLTFWASYNGRKASIVQWCIDKNQYCVRLSNGNELWVRPTNIVLPSETSTTSTENQFTVEFKDHKSDPWGQRVAFDQQAWRVSVYPGKQSERLGVKSGDKILSINDEILNEKNKSSFQEKLIKGIACRITFVRQTYNPFEPLSILNEKPIQLLEEKLQAEKKANEKLKNANQNLMLSAETVERKLEKELKSIEDAKEHIENLKKKKTEITIAENAKNKAKDAQRKAEHKAANAEMRANRLLQKSNRSIKNVETQIQKLNQAKLEMDNAKMAERKAKEAQKNAERRNIMTEKRVKVGFGIFGMISAIAMVTNLIAMFRGEENEVGREKATTTTTTTTTTPNMHIITEEEKEAKKKNESEQNNDEKRENNSKEDKINLKKENERVSCENIPTKQVVFQPGSMGFSLNENVIQHIIPGSQAANAGVRCGWVVLKVNGETQGPDYASIKEALEKTYNFQKKTVILFQKKLS